MQKQQIRLNRFASNVCPDMWDQFIAATKSNILDESCITSHLHEQHSSAFVKCGTNVANKRSAPFTIPIPSGANRCVRVL